MMRKLSVLVAGLVVSFFCYDASALIAEARAFSFCTEVNAGDTACRSGYVTTFHKGTGGTLYKRLTSCTKAAPPGMTWTTCETWSPEDTTSFDDVQGASASCCFEPQFGETNLETDFAWWNPGANSWSAWGATDADGSWTEGPFTNWCIGTDIVYQGYEFDGLNDAVYISEENVMACYGHVDGLGGEITKGFQYTLD